MSVTPEALTQLLAGGGGVAAQPGPSPATAAAPGNEPPAGGPMMAPAPKEGDTAAAMVKISTVFQLLEQALPAFGAQSDQGKAIVDVLKKLSGSFGEQRAGADQLIPAQLMELMQSVVGAGGGSPAAQAMGGAPAQLSM